MHRTLRTSLLALSTVLTIGLAGCDRADQAAESVTREVGRMAAEEARKALQSTGEAVNRGIDNAQEASRRWLDGAEGAAQDEGQKREEDQRAPAQAPRGDRGQSI